MVSVISVIIILSFNHEITIQKTSRVKENKRDLTLMKLTNPFYPK
jgi:hypothetical protein